MRSETVSALALLALLSPMEAPAQQRASKPESQSDRCAALRLEALPVCAASGAGLVFGKSRDAVAKAASQAATGERNFQRYFGGPVEPYVILLGEEAAEATPHIQAAGYRLVFPWMTDAEKLAAMQRSIRAALEQRLRQSGVPESDIPGKIDGALSQLAMPSALQDEEDALLPHELGHTWFHDRYWRGAHSGGHYGGPAPDWLDEAAGLLMEPEASVERRRLEFREALANGAAEARDLKRFLAQAHPLAGRTGANGFVTVSRAATDASGRPTVGPGQFYGQSRVFAEFLIARSGDERILAEIAKAIAAGETFEAWLAARGSAHGLGGSVTELNTAWLEWLDETFDQPPH